jgi:hypothetical protein
MEEMIYESQGTDLLAKMLKFYSRRYASNQQEMEKKFNDAAEDLIREKDVTRAEYMEFCLDNDIEPRSTGRGSGSSGSSSGSSSGYSGDSCGGWGGWRSSC